MAEPKHSDADMPPSSTRERPRWHRTPGLQALHVPLTGPDFRPVRTEVPGSRGLVVVTSLRPVAGRTGVPPGTRCVSVFLVNERKPTPDYKRDEDYAFQVGLTLRLEEGFVPRPNLRGFGGDDWDEQVADLQYRDCFE